MHVTEHAHKLHEQHYAVHLCMRGNDNVIIDDELFEGTAKAAE